MTWDVFISHAADDKEEIARPLAVALRDAGYEVWFDEFSLSLGDGLVRSIDRGLAECRYGIVIISPRFLAKDWPRRELEGLVTREIGRGKIVLPVWHRVTREEIERVSPTLADRLAASTDCGLEHVVAQVRQVLDAEAPPGPRRLPALAPSGRRRRALIAGSTGAALALGSGAWWWQARRAAALGAIAGLWRIEASGEMLRSTLDLRVVDGDLQGSVEIHYPDHPDFVLSGLYAQRKVAIAEGQWDGRRLAFVTRRRLRKSLGADGTEATQLLRYHGRLDGAVLALTIEVEGGPVVEAQARRPPPRPAGTALIATLPAPQRTSANQLLALPDGAVGTIYGSGVVRIWRIDGASGKASWTQWQHGNAVEGLLPLAPGRLLVVDADGAVQERDVRSGEKRRDLPRLPRPVGAVLAIDGRLVAIGDPTGGIMLWNRDTEKVERTLRDGDGQTVRLARLPDGRIVGGDASGAVRIWSLASGRVERTLQEGDSGIGSGPAGLVVLPDGRIVAGDPRREPPLLIGANGDAASRIDLGAPTAWSAVLGLSVDGQVLLVDSRLLLSLWNPQTSAMRPLVDFSADEIGIDCAFSLTATRLLLGRRDGTLQLWAIG